MRTLVTLFAVLAMAALPVAAASPQKAAGGSTRGTASKSNAAPSSPININTATQAQFESLPGIGPKVAQRIVEYRQKNGQFKKVEEILESPRSGADLLRILRDGWPPPVSKSPRKSQQISRCFANGGRSGGRSSNPRTGREGQRRRYVREDAIEPSTLPREDSTASCLQIRVFNVWCQGRGSPTGVDAE